MVEVKADDKQNNEKKRNERNIQNENEINSIASYVLWVGHIWCHNGKSIRLSSRHSICFLSRENFFIYLLLYI